MRRRPRIWVPLAMVAAAVTSAVTTGSAPARAAGSTPPTYGTFHVVARSVVADTTTGMDTSRSALAAHQTRRFAVAGHGGVPSKGVAAVLVQVSALRPAHPSSLLTWNASVRPHIAAMPAPAGKVTSETLPVGLHNGSIAVTNGASATNARVVIEGWWGTAPDATGVHLRPVPSISILDTTVHAGEPQAIDLYRTYRVPGLPSAVLLTVSADAASTTGTVTLSPDSAPAGYPADVAVAPGQTTSTTSLVAVSTQYEQITLATSAASVHVHLDLVGAAGHPDEAVAPDAGMRLDPVRVLDTLDATSAPARPMRAGETRSFRLAGEFGLPDDHVGAIAVAVTVTARDPSAGVRLLPARAFGIDDSRVVARRGQPVMATRVVRPGSGGELTISSTGSADVEVDVLGYWTASALSVPNLMVNALAAGTMTDTPSSGLRDLTFSSDGALLYAADVDSPLLRRYDVRYGIELAPIHLAAPATGLDLQPDGRTAIVVEPTPSEGPALGQGGVVTAKVESVDLVSGSRAFVPTAPTLSAVDVVRMSDGTLLYAAPGSSIATSADRRVAWQDAMNTSLTGRWDEVDRTWLGGLSGYTLSVDDDGTVVSPGPDTVLMHPADGPERTTSIVAGYPPGCRGAGLTSDGTRLRRVVGSALQDIDTETGAIVGQDQLPDDCDSPYYPLSGEVVVGPGGHTIAVATRHGLSLVLPR